jgi:hypothetical protein
MALQPGSPAINSGAPGCPPIDQRGEVRDGVCDIGPYEYLATTLEIYPANQSVAPGGTAVFSLSISTSDPNPQPFDLSLTNSYPEILVSVWPVSVPPGGTATLTVTDTHPSAPILPGLWYSLPILAERAGESVSGSAGLLVGGYSIALPIIRNSQFWP